MWVYQSFFAGKKLPAAAENDTMRAVRLNQKSKLVGRTPNTTSCCKTGHSTEICRDEGDLQSQVIILCRFVATNDSNSTKSDFLIYTLSCDPFFI